MTKKTAQDMVKDAYDHAGLQGSMHWLRHTWVTELLEAGVPPHVVKDMAGHADIQTTLKHYAHARTDALVKGAEALAAKRRADRR